jgi:hypothetical protein
LRVPWGFDENERLREGANLVVGDTKPRSQVDLTIGPRSLIGRFLRRGQTWSATSNDRLPEKDVEVLVRDLIKALENGGYVEQVSPGAYQLQAGAMRWKLGDGSVQHDPVRIPNEPSGDSHVQQFFVDLYRMAATNLRQLEAREHTAQVPSEERQKRESRFGQADLPILYCSPTMELGVDIQDLNAVNLRNVPPTPANYAQRSGRAGRSGQPALVLTYCTSTSPHDQYYFRRPERMVAGSVAPPRLDLANEDLIRSHVHAVWHGNWVSLGSAVSDR